MRTRTQVVQAAARLLIEIEFSRDLDPKLYQPFGPTTHFPELDEPQNEARANFEWGILVGKRQALRWVLSGRWDQPDRELLSRDLARLVEGQK